MDRVLIAPLDRSNFQSGRASPYKDELPAAPLAKGFRPQQMATAPARYPVLPRLLSAAGVSINSLVNAAPALGGLARAVLWARARNGP
jgi:hypothetical protein